MSGTTLCPYCNTRFKIAEPQLEAYRGMVRCGHCLKAFDAYPGYIPEQPNPQLELPILDEQITPDGELTSNGHGKYATHDNETYHARFPHPIPLPEGEGSFALSPSGGKMKRGLETNECLRVFHSNKPDTAEAVHAVEGDLFVEETGSIEAISSAWEAKYEGNEPQKTPLDELLESNQPADQRDKNAPPDKLLRELHVMKLDENIMRHDKGDRPSTPEYRRWHREAAAFLMLMVLLVQATYFFRVDLAARLPYLRPALTGACQSLGCSVPLPQRTNLMSIESSDIEADPALGNHIILNALLRNRATYAQAFPNLEITLNDTQDKPLARRIFKPEDYLPPLESKQDGLLPDHELSVKLFLDIADLKPSGYRLVLFYARH